MLRYMERSTIQYLKKRGWSNQQIAEFTGHHRETIARVLREPVDRLPAPRSRPSAIEIFDEQITQWLDEQLSATRMLELARAHPDHPYHGGHTAFYTYVRKRRRERGQFTARDVALRFEGLPGEYLQVDWAKSGSFPSAMPTCGARRAISLRRASNIVASWSCGSSRICARKRCCAVSLPPFAPSAAFPGW